MSINLLHVDGIVICSGDGLVYEVPLKFLFTFIPSALLPCMFRLNGWLIKGAVSRQSSSFCLILPTARLQSLWNLMQAKKLNVNDKIRDLFETNKYVS